MRLIRNPVVQFLAAGLVVLAVVVVGTGRLSSRAAEEEALADARTTTEVLARVVAEPAVPYGLVDMSPAAMARFDAAVRDRLEAPGLRRVKVWRTDGRIIWSDDADLIKERHTLGPEERKVLAGGDADADVSDLKADENHAESGKGGLVEVYTRIVSPEGQPLLFEAYYSAEDIAIRSEQVFAEFRPITLGGLLVLVAVTTPLLWALTRRLSSAAASRERLLRAAVDASESERRRIARDLHQGVVQDLAGTVSELSALARAEATEWPTVERLNPLNDTLHESLRALRSLLVEIYPPDLDASGLAAALEDLVAPATGSGVQAAVRVSGVDGASDEAVALVWRAAQEAVRNALRHSRCTHLEVEVTGADGRLGLRVADDGVGFVPGAFTDTGRLGLRGLRDLVREAGGSIDVDSGPGRGTTVRLQVAAR